MKIRPLIALFIVLAPFVAASNLTYQSPYTPMAEYSFSQSGDYLIDDLYVRGMGGNEIDGTESLNVAFSYPVIMQNIQLGLLFAGDTAVLHVGPDTYALRAYGFNQARYYKNGVLIADLFEDESDWSVGENLYGMYTLHDPFGSSVIDAFTFSAHEGGFGLMSFNTLDQMLMPRDVPDSATTIGLMLIGMVVLMTIKRRAIC